MTKNAVNPADGVYRVFRGMGTGYRAIVNASPLIPKVGKSQKITITGRN